MSDNKVETSASDERLRIWLNFVKFLLGTVILGAVTLLVNSEIQKQRLEFEIRSKENEFIAQFLDKALDKDLEKRRDFAEYFVRLTPTEESRGRWVEYRNYAQKLVEDSQRRAEEIEVGESKLSDLFKALQTGTISADMERLEMEKTIADLERQLTKQQRELASIRSEPATTTVPSLIGLVPLFAIKTVDFANLLYVYAGISYSSEIPEGMIMAQSPAAGTRVRVGTQVSVKISLGSPSAGKEPVPSLNPQMLPSLQ